MKILVAAVWLLISSFSIFAQTRIVPIIEMKVRGLLGGVENGKFVDAKTTAAALKGDEKYKLFRIDGAKKGTLSFGKPKNDGDVCEDFYYIDYDYDKNLSGIALGGSPGWEPMPRAPKSIDLNDASYKKIVADVLRTKGIAKTTVKLTQAVRVDLDGDGQEEVLITATRYTGEVNGLNATAGDYSFVLLRKIVAGRVKNIVLAGDFIKNKTDYGIPSTYEISSIADLNGDGKMEIVLYSAYYEGNSAWAIEMKGNKPADIEILSVGCGV
ncbi:MAG TPA: VCBS repeat-containing protein [Pyrinomonadaceae bacterium]|jgi:hypothetical protein